MAFQANISNDKCHKDPYRQCWIEHLSSDGMSTNNNGRHVRLVGGAAGGGCCSPAGWQKCRPS